MQILVIYNAEIQLKTRVCPKIETKCNLKSSESQSLCTNSYKKVEENVRTASVHQSNSKHLLRMRNCVFDFTDTAHNHSFTILISLKVQGHFHSSLECSLLHRSMRVGALLERPEVRGTKVWFGTSVDLSGTETVWGMYGLRWYLERTYLAPLSVSIL